MAATPVDVVIVGAGPAGTTAAYELAVHGVRVLILEKTPFPRYKVCGAGLTHKILQEIPYSLDPVIETTIRSVRFSYRFDEVFTRMSEVPLMYCTMRDRLDSYMLEKAVESGARVIFGEQVTGIIRQADQVIVSTRSGEYPARLVVGADGVSGIVSRAAGLRKDIDLGLAWEAELETDPELVKSLSETVFLDWGTFPGGYAWMFPKQDHLSIGVGGPARLSKRMITYYQDFLKTFPAPHSSVFIPHSSLSGPPSSLHSWPIPVRRRKGDFHTGRVLIAGDAAGLTDPMTGEGIWYAVRSGKIAATACRDFLGGNPSSLAHYSEEINATLMDDLVEACRIRDLFNVVPGKIHRLVRDNDRVWRAFGKVLRGERQYADVRTGFGKYEFLWGITTFIAGMLYINKEKRFRNG